MTIPEASPNTIPDTPSGGPTGSAPEYAPIFITWNKREYEVVVTEYIDNGNTCICFLNPKTGVVEAKATANLRKLPPHRVYIKDYSENRGIADVLVSRRLIYKVGSAIQNGSEEFEEYELLQRLASAFNLKLPERESEPVLDKTLSQDIPKGDTGTDSEPAEESVEEPDSAVTHEQMVGEQNAQLVERAREMKAEQAAKAETEISGDNTPTPNQ